jgi:DNA invertase Pin-like site-specific DNA recombinase
MLAYIICGDSTGDDSPMANLMLSVIGAVAEFENALILGPQRGALQVKGMLCNKRG